MCTSQLMTRSLLPTLGAPPSTSMPPGVRTRGPMMSSGIGVPSSSAAPRVKVAISLAAGAPSFRMSGGPFLAMCSDQSRSYSTQRRSSGQFGRIIAALYSPIARQASSRLIRPSCAMRT